MTSSSMNSFYTAYLVLGAASGVTMVTMSVYWVESVKVAVYPMYVTIYMVLDTITA